MYLVLYPVVRYILDDKYNLNRVAEKYGLV